MIGDLVYVYIYIYIYTCTHNHSIEDVVSFLLMDLSPQVVLRELRRYHTVFIESESQNLTRRCLRFLLCFF